MMRISRSLASGGDVVLSFALGVDLTVRPAHVCFGFTVVGVGFWHLVDGVALRTCPLILILSSEITDPDVDGSSLESDG